jgi:hypothetical protein
VAADTGDLMLKCHAGCTFDQIIDAVGVRKESLLAERSDYVASREVAAYKYHDEAGELLYEVVRFEPKDFRCRRVVHGQADWGLGATRRVLYRLPQIITEKDRVVIVVEGEKAANRVVSEGFLATCSPGGAGKWKSEYAKALAGRRVILLPDNDDVGRDHMEDVKESLEGLTGEVATLELDVPPKGDVVDWFDAGGTASGFRHLCKEALHAEHVIRELTTLSRTDRWRAIHHALYSLE